MKAETPSRFFQVCRGDLFVNGERVPVHRRVLKIGLAAAGMDDGSCEPLSERAARRILQLERSLLLAGLEEEIRRALDGGRAA